MNIPPDIRVQQHHGLVLRIACRAHRFSGYAGELEDLTAEGTIGLLQAAERFDESHMTNFEHYASVRIHGAVYDYLRKFSPISQRRRREAHRHRGIYERLQVQLGREPEPQEMANALGMELEEYYQLNNELSAKAPLSLTDMEGFDPRADGQIADSILASLQMRNALQAVVAKLPEKMQFVIKMVYYRGLSQKEAATDLGVTEARVSQIHQEALDRLKKHCLKQEALLPDSRLSELWDRRPYTPPTEP